jgi:hypothetical protein
MIFLLHGNSFSFFLLWEGISLPDMENPRSIFGVSGKYTGVGSGSSISEGFVTISSVRFGLFTPGVKTVNKIQIHCWCAPKDLPLWGIVRKESLQTYRCQSSGCSSSSSSSSSSSRV